MAEDEQVLSREYIRQHNPEKEFDFYDFDRMSELARFGWVVMKVIMDNAAGTLGPRDDTGPKSMKIPVEFEIKPAMVEDDDGTIRPLCIDTNVIVHGGSDMLPGCGVTFTSHQPCIHQVSAGVWERRPRKVRRPQGG